MIEWKVKKGDFVSACGKYEIERASEDSWWAYKNMHPVGMYSNEEQAIERCEKLEAKDK